VILIVWKNKSKKPNFYVREGEVRSVVFTNKLMVLLVYKEAYHNTNDFDHVVPSVIVSLLQEFKYVFPKDIPNGLPLLRRIEHHIDLVPEAMIPNRQTYRRMCFERKLMN
jgi:hypothetical protein